MRLIPISMSTLSILACLSPASYAADWLTSPAYVYDWSGTYAGAQIGFGGGPAVSNELNWPSNTFGAGPLEYNAEGFFGGLHIGRNMQSGSFVYGLEADAEYSDVKGTWDWNNGNMLNKHIRWAGSLRARAGYAMDRVLVYGTAGAAVASVKMEVIDGGPVGLSDTDTTFGWTAGGGAEYAIDNTWSTRIEYRYTDYGETDVAGSVFGGSWRYPHSNKVHAVRLGVSRKF